VGYEYTTTELPERALVGKGAWAFDSPDSADGNLCLYAAGSVLRILLSASSYPLFIVVHFRTGKQGMPADTEKKGISCYLAKAIGILGYLTLF